MRRTVRIHALRVADGMYINVAYQDSITEMDPRYTISHTWQVPV
jgi:hypothetical protein